MSLGQNLQFLRTMRNRMTQEELAHRMEVSRQTVSKWELDMVYPEINKLIELCDLFSCSMDEMVRGDMNVNDEAYSDIRIEIMKPFSYIKYASISVEPEDDAIYRVRQWAKEFQIQNPEIIGWDFPFVSQEQINVFNMHGYEAALILSDDIKIKNKKLEVFQQEMQKYIAITIKEPQIAPFRLIPNAYKVLLTHMKINGIKHSEERNVISCFEKEYDVEGGHYLDVYIAIE